MNSDRQRPDAAGADDSARRTKQWILIGVLSVVLVGALRFSPAGPEETDQGTATGTTGTLAVEPSLAETTPAPSQPVPVPSQEVLHVRQLPRLDIDRIVAVNPMAVVALASEVAGADAASPEPPPEPEAPVGEETPEPMAEAAEPLPQQPQRSRAPEPPPVRVQAVYGSDRGAAALVEEQIVRPGQPLADGRKVLEVSAHGVRVGGKTRPDPAPDPAPPPGVEIYDFSSN